MDLVLRKGQDKGRPRRGVRVEVTQIIVIVFGVKEVVPDVLDNVKRQNLFRNVTFVKI